MPIAPLKQLKVLPRVRDKDNLSFYNFGDNDSDTDLLLEYLSTISSGIWPLNNCFDKPFKYLIIAHVPAFINKAIKTFIAGPYVLFRIIIGIMSFMTFKLNCQHFQNKVNCDSFKFPKCIEFLSEKSWYKSGAQDHSISFD